MFATIECGGADAPPIGSQVSAAVRGVVRKEMRTMGAPRYTVPLQKIVTEQGLTVLHTAADYATRAISTADVNRPGLQLAGFYNYFDPERLQIIGRVESTFLETLTPAQRRERFETFMRYNIIGLVICHGMDPFPECLEMAEKYDRNLFLVRKDTSEFMADLIASLSSYLAPRLTQHGVLVEVFGEGVLITGDSGVGKSETALELIKRGHRLVADDAVEIKRINRTTLMGSAPEMIRYYMELRGIGVIDARQIYGVGAVKPESRVDLVVQLEPWEDGRAYDRLGLTTEYCEILNVRVPCVTIPVGPGRNLAVILELAAMNNRQKGMGYNAAQKLAAEGYREIVVNGIEISSWGHDFKDGSSLIDLLEAVSAAAGDMRLRLGSLEPRTITEDFCRRAARLPNLCEQFHLSLQSGCDETLRRMNRRYDTARFAESVHLLRAYFDRPAITTDLITGFPGETEEEFAQTLDFIRACDFARMHIFPYSIRPGTKAAAMEQLPRAVKEERAARAAAVAEQMRQSYLAGCVGCTYPVLFEQPKDGRYAGHAPNYTDVEVDGENLHNEVRAVEITGVEGDILIGRIV